MTTPTPELKLVDGQVDDDVVHIWCERCNTRNPMRSVCGQSLDKQDQVEDGGPDCGACDDLWATHVKALHPGMRPA